MSKITSIFGGAEWQAKLISNKKGEVAALECNAMLMMREHPELRGVFGLDEFHQRSCLMRRPPWRPPSDDDFPLAMSDADLADLLAWLQCQGLHLHGRSPVRTALASVVRDKTFHPVRSYLDGLVWDEKPRLDHWLTDYLGVASVENYTASAGRWWMISAVARIYQPGCLVKYVLIIEGAQDLGKSTALRILGGPWFTDDIATLGTKDAQMQIGNAWIVELAELHSARLAHIDAIKSFISRPVDRFRPPYGEHVIEQPRQSVLAATVNPAGPYLHDETGAVRFWPVRATQIDTEALKNDRDQLWAEAVALFKAGKGYWPDADFRPLAEQESRTDTADNDPWFDVVVEWLSPKYQMSFQAHEILKGALEIPTERMDKRAERRLGSILRQLGYVSKGGRAGRRWEKAIPEQFPRNG
jgi:predicted P-loop ATPase